jgi:DNA-directed RNA polymerase specialized sigma24 family protein
MTKIQRLKSLVETRATELRRWLETSEAADEVWLRLELADAVRGVLAELPADYAALLTGKYLDGRTLDDLALASGGTVEATKSKLARARREFRARMETLVREPNTRRPDCEVR